MWVYCTLVDSSLRVYEACVSALTDEERARYYDESKGVARLFQIPEEHIPASVERVLFTSSGAESVEAAIKLGRAATRRSRVHSATSAFPNTWVYWGGAGLPQGFDGAGMAFELEIVVLENGTVVEVRVTKSLDRNDFSPAPVAGKHDDSQFGTHHARDASKLLETIGWKPKLFSSAMKLNTQYMHSLWFDLEFTQPMTREKAMERLRNNRRIAITEKRSANQIFSFGRDHGYYGRILSQAVVAAPTVTVSGDREVVGFCFTPQDGNSLASSIAAALWLMDPDYNRRERLSVLDRFFFREI